MKRLSAMILGVSMALAPFGAAQASLITGGDALNQAAADSLLDIMFLIDTSGSMVDDINSIGSVAANAIGTLECPDCDVWVRARFMGIAGIYGTVFNESYDSVYPTAEVNHVEDNGWGAWAAINAAENTWWTNDAVAGQNYYRAVVTIGDEGTDNGQPVSQADWDAAYAANQAAINSDVILFSWVTNDPYAGVVDLFEKMALGGSGGGYSFGFANGAFINDQDGTGDVTRTLQAIICETIIIDPPPPVPEPSTWLLMGSGLGGLIAFRKRFARKQ